MESKDLLEDVVEQSLERALAFDPGSEGHTKAVKTGMDVTDRIIELEKIEERKLELEIKKKELELKKKFEKIDRVIKCVEVIVVPLAITGFKCGFDFVMSRELIEYEKTGIIADTPLKMLVRNLYKR